MIVTSWVAETVVVFESTAVQVTMVEPTGPETYAFVETPVGSLVARVPGKVSQRVGDNVMLQWDPAHAHLFDAGTGARL